MQFASPSSSAVLSLPMQDNATKPLSILDDTAGPNSFSDTLTKALNGVSATNDRAMDMQQRFASGDQTVELHQVMAATEESGLATDLLIELRNKTVEAYRSVINMQS